MSKKNPSPSDEYVSDTLTLERNTNLTPNSLPSPKKKIAPSGKKPLWRRRRVIWTAGIIAVILLVSMIGISGKRGRVISGPTATVMRGPLVVSITESGELEAEKRKVISNELTWAVIIRQLVDEGTLVEKGQQVVQFECQELVDAIDQEKLDVNNAQNAYTQASQNLELKKEEMASNIRKAERALDQAQEDRDLYLQHDYQIQLAGKESDLQEAEQQLKLDEDNLEFKNHANGIPELEKPFSDNDIAAETLKVQQTRNKVKTARLNLEKFQQFDHKRKLGDLDAEVSDAELELKRNKLESQKQLLMAEAEEQAKKQAYDQRKKKLDTHLEEQQKLTVTAEEAGLVVYDTGQQRWETPIRVAVGEKINPRQQVMVIPDMTTLQIKTKVYEAMIDQVHPGLPAVIRLDAKSGMVVKGEVSKVSVLPDSQNQWLNPGVKIFSVTVGLVNPPEGLKPGMTAQVELELCRLDNVLSVPVAAVFTEQQKTFCRRKIGDSVEKVQVKVGRMNEKRVEILSGLEEGDTVMLVPVEASSEEKNSENNGGGEKQRSGKRGERPA